MDLPQKFIQRMKIQLKEEWKDYHKFLMNRILQV